MDPKSRKAAIIIQDETAYNANSLMELEKKIDNLSLMIADLTETVAALSKSNADLVSEMRRAAEERDRIKDDVRQLYTQVEDLNSQLAEAKQQHLADKKRVESALLDQELLADQLEYRDRMRSMRWHGVTLSESELRDNTLLAKKIYDELYLPFSPTTSTHNPEDWRHVVEWAHPIKNKPTKKTAAAPYHVIFKITTRYYYDIIFNNRKKSLSKYNTESDGKDKCFIQRDCTKKMRDAMAYLRSVSGINPARVFISQSGKVCFFRHSAPENAKAEVCANYLRRPLAEMLS